MKEPKEEFIQIKKRITRSLKNRLQEVKIASGCSEMDDQEFYVKLMQLGMELEEKRSKYYGDVQPAKKKRQAG